MTPVARAALREQYDDHLSLSRRIDEADQSLKLITRQLSAWLGLVPQQFGTGGKVRLGNISKRENTYLRVLLIHGGRTVLNWAKKKDDDLSTWAKAVANRCGKHKAIVAIANKTARMVWVTLNKGIEAVPRRYLSAS